MRTIYIKMKTENGGTAYRNMAPQSATNKISFATSSQPGTTASRIASIADVFVPLQTETPDFKDGKYQLKLVDEWMFEEEPLNINNVLPGGDAWTDTTDEKLLTYLTDGDKNYTVKFAHAASSVDPSHQSTGPTQPGSYLGALRDYADAISQNFRTGDMDETVEAGYVDWVSMHLTGTRDSVVAQPL